MNEGKIVLLGIFDGVHIGHAALIGVALKLKAERGLPIVMYTFSSNEKSARLITTDEQKEKIAKGKGVDEIYFEEFTDSFKHTSCEDFVSNILKDKLSARYVVVGANYRFGYKKCGDPRKLKELCEKRGIGAVIVPKVRGASSSRIRDLIEQGDIARVNILLGRPFSVTGIVAQGKKRNLGFRTANLILPPNSVIPNPGVYFTNTGIGGAMYNSITNIGKNPTFGNDSTTAETHILNFDGKLYGKVISVNLLQFVRKEKKFAAADELKAQVDADIKKAKEYFERQTQLNE